MSSTNLSEASNSSWLYSAHHTQKHRKGAMLYTGPDGIRDHRIRVEDHHHYVGEGTMSPEGTSGVDYLWRAPGSTGHHRPKTGWVGEVGWGVPKHADWQAANTGAQITLGEFRQAVEDRHTHLYQSAWYPGPGETFPHNSDAALVMNVYRDGNSAPSQERARTSQGQGRGTTQPAENVGQDQQASVTVDQPAQEAEDSSAQQ